MTRWLFLVFLALIASAVVGLASKYVSRRAALRVGTGLVLWLAYVGGLGYAGVLRNASLRPPGIVYVLVPVFLFIGFALIRSSAGSKFALALPLPLLLGAQSFRIGVELLLHQLWIDGVVPRMLTFEGGNVDIFIGISAPLAAWLSTRGKAGLRLALGWSVLGLAVLANVAIRSAMTAPGPLNILHTEVPNLAMSTFPFFYIPGFFAPLAVALHVLAIRAVRTKQRAAAAVPEVERELTSLGQAPGFGATRVDGRTP